MPSKSRLGKGLGALFPALPGEEVEAQETDGKAEGSKAKEEKRNRAQEKVGRRNTVSASKNRRGNPGSGPLTSDGVSGDSSDEDRVLTAEQVSRETLPDRKKASMPRILDLGNLEHPSDLFFGSGPTKRSSEGGTKLSASHKQEKQGRKASRVGTGHRAGGQARQEGTSQDPTTKADRAGQEEDGLKPIRGGYLVELQTKDICPNAQQPRHIFDEDELAELARSITEVGVLQPIVVRRINTVDGRGGQRSRTEKKNGHVKEGGQEEPTYEIVMGERRWRATQLAGLTTIPAIVKTTSDDLMLRDALLENLHRAALNPLEEAAAYQQMIDEFGLTQDGLSKSISKSRPQITNTLRLLKLPPSVQKNVSSGVLSAGHARALLTLPTEDEMVDLAKKIIAEGLSVRATEELVALKTGQVKPRKKSAKSDIWKESPVRQDLENRLDTTVNIRGTKEHGRIEIVFSSPEDMDRILSLLLEKQGEDGGDLSASDGGWV